MSDQDWETDCPKRDDGQHCSCWYDNERCCACGAEAGDDYDTARADEGPATRRTEPPAAVDATGHREGAGMSDYPRDAQDAVELETRRKVYLDELHESTERIKARVAAAEQPWPNTPSITRAELEARLTPEKLQLAHGMISVRSVKDVEGRVWSQWYGLEDAMRVLLDAAFQPAKEQ